MNNENFSNNKQSLLDEILVDEDVTGIFKLVKIQSNNVTYLRVYLNSDMCPYDANAITGKWANPKWVPT